MEKGDRLLLYTDGIFEAANSSGDRFGPERLKGLLVGKALGYVEFLDQLFESLRDFGIADPPEDDCSALMLDIRGNDL